MFYHDPRTPSRAQLDPSTSGQEKVVEEEGTEPPLPETEKVTVRRKRTDPDPLSPGPATRTRSRLGPKSKTQKERRRIAKTARRLSDSLNLETTDSRLTRAIRSLFQQGEDKQGDKTAERDESGESDLEEVAHDSDPDEPLPRVLYGRHSPASRASTPEHDVIDLIDDQEAAFGDLSDEEVIVHPKHIPFKMNADQAKALTEALTSLGDVLAVKRTEADHICKMDQFFHDKMDAQLWWERYAQYCTLKHLPKCQTVPSMC